MSAWVDSRRPPRPRFAGPLALLPILALVGGSLLLTTHPAHGQAAQPTLWPTPTAQRDGRILYIVAPGDTLTLVALRFGLSLDDLYELNDLGPDSILTIGQSILLGRESAGPEAESTSAVAGFPGTRIHPDGTIAHVVVEGDTLITIAVKYNLTLEELYELSGLSEQDLLRIGQEVIVGRLSEPADVGGSADVPAQETATPAVTATPSPSPTATPSPTQALAVNPTAAPPLAGQAAATPLAAAPAIQIESDGILPIFFGMIALLVITGLLFLYLAHRQSQA
jgi:LysM repeat protein